jgi:subtilisin family serine protease
MDPVTSSQYIQLKDAFAREGIEIEVASTPGGGLDYLYAVGLLLAVDRDDNVERLQAVLPGLRRTDPDEHPQVGDLVVLSTDEVSIDEADVGSMTVLEVLDLIDERLEDNPGPAGGEPLATPVHIVHLAKVCQAGEPEVPSGYPTQPWPAPSQAGGGTGVTIAASDTGLQPDLDQYPWLTRVRGDPEPPGSKLPSGLQRIRKYAGHGTFVAGVAACTAPGADVYVNDHFTKSGGELEHVIIQKLEELIRNQSPDVLCLSAGTYCRNGWASLGFGEFRRRHPDITLVAAGGNDFTDEPFYPAAFSWVVGVGALATDQQHRAWFSNYGRWMDVYTLGQGMVNAFARGVYTYQEPPKQPAKQTFDGMAKWEGTSFSAPLVAGLIAEEMARNKTSAQAAAKAVLHRAKAQAMPGVGPALFPPP